jgi:hypothetical protein
VLNNNNIFEGYRLETKTIKDGNPQKDVGHNKKSSSSVKCRHARKGAIRDCVSSK